MEIRDPDVKILASLAASLEADYMATDEGWEGSPFAWIKKRAPRQKGKISEQLVAGWLAARGFNVARSPDSDADRIIESKRVEIKFSMLWENGGYTFQQLRDQNYDIAVCLGVSPFDAHCWVLEKAEILRQWHDIGHISSQHGGAAGIDTAWFSLVPQNPPEWLRPHGGRLRSAIRVLSQLTGFTPESLDD